MHPDPPSLRQRLYYPQDFFVRPSWYSEGLPFAPFSLRYQPWNERIFQCLRGSKHSFPVDFSSSKGGTTFSLSLQLQTKWWRLEQSLIALYQNVLSMRPNFLHPLDFQRVRHPSEWGYMRSFASEEAARIVILNSRNSFVLLIALCTYAIAITEGRSGALEPRYRSLEWIRVLVERHNTDSVWLDDLSSSHFMSIRTLRAGVYINWETFNSPHILQLYLNYGVPVWIRMPVDPTDMKLQSSIRLTRTQVSALLKSRQQQQQQQQPVPMYYPTSTETISTTSSNDPPSRQRPGESALEFITRNISAND